MGGFIIAQAAPNDFLALRELQRLTLGGLIVDGEHSWRVWINYCSVFKATENGVLAGGVLAFPVTSGRILVHQLFVHPDYINQGIGTALLRAATQDKTKEYFLTSAPDNPMALRVYEKCGFVKEKLVKGYYRPDEDRYVLVRKKEGNENTHAE